MTGCSPREKIKEERLRARTNLFYLSTNVLGYDLVPDVHEQVCDFFVHKDPSKGVYEQDTVRARLLLDPRGHFKTTIDICDTIQWLLCFPDIRILMMSGTLDLAKEILTIVRNHFMYNTRLRELFPSTP